MAVLGGGAVSSQQGTPVRRSLGHVEGQVWPLGYLADDAAQGYLAHKKTPTP
jgi:hypothetical protein